MIPIMNKNDEYNNIIDNQANSFSFNINDQPYKLFLNFTKENLEPPLLAIKKIYDKIQDELLLQIFKKVDEMPDYYTFIVEKLPTDNLTEIILNITSESEELFQNYSNNVIKDSKSYRNKFNDLRRLYDIKKLLYLKQKSNLRNIKGKKLNNNKNKTEKIEENENYNDNIKQIKNRKISNVYNEYLCFDDVEKLVISNNYLIGNFSVLYLNNDFRYLNTTLKTFVNKIINYLKKLENPLSIITLRMSTLLTEEKLEQLRTKLYTEMNLIKKYSNNHSDIISSKVKDFMHLLSNDSIVLLNDTTISIKNNVEKLYDDLLVYILSKFKTKSFKFTQEDIEKNEYDYDLTTLILGIDDPLINNVGEYASKLGVGINFDAEDYLDLSSLEKLLGSLDKYMNNDKTLFEIDIPFAIFSIPFIARFKLEYGFEIGIEIYTKNHYLISHLYAEAHSCASASAGIYLGTVEFGGGLRGLLGYGRVGIKPNINFKYLINKIEFYVKLATLRFQVFAYLLLPFPEIIWINVRFLFITIRIPFIIFVQKRFEIGSQWTTGLQKYISYEKEF